MHVQLPDLYQMAEDRPSGRKKTESSVGHENLEFATTDYDYVVPIAEFYTVSQKIPTIFDCNFKKNDQVLIIFGMNIPDTTCHQIAV